MRPFEEKVNKHPISDSIISAIIIQQIPGFVYNQHNNNDDIYSHSQWRIRENSEQSPLQLQSRVELLLLRKSSQTISVSVRDRENVA